MSVVGHVIAQSKNATARSFPAPDRLEVIAPDSTVLLGHELRMGIKISGDVVVGAFITQDDVSGGEAGGHRVGEDDSSNLSLNSSGNGIVSLVPTQPGLLNVHIMLEFADGALAERTVVLNVVPTNEDVEGFSLNGFPSIPLVLGQNPDTAQTRLVPEVKYVGYRGSLYLRGCAGINVTVSQSPDDPVVAVDKDCMVRGIRPGEAVIIGNFGGKVSRVKVHVYSEEDAPDEYREELPVR